MSDSQAIDIDTSLLEEPIGILDITLDIVSATIAVTSAFLIYKGI